MAGERPGESRVASLRGTSPGRTLVRTDMGETMTLPPPRRLKALRATAIALLALAALLVSLEVTEGQPPPVFANDVFEQDDHASVDREALAAMPLVCNPDELPPAQSVLCKDKRRKEGRRLFDRETFGGNGRTCVTCHSEETGTFSPEDAQARLADDASQLPPAKPVACDVNRPRRFRVVSRSRAAGFGEPPPAAQREPPFGGSSFHMFSWSTRLSSSSCRWMYSRTVASSRPTVETKYPRAQKCCPA